MAPAVSNKWLVLRELGGGQLHESLVTRTK